MKSVYLIVVFLVGCAGAVVVPPASSPPPAPAELRADWPVAYTAIASQALDDLGAPLLEARPADLAEWCPGYTREKGKRFYIALFSALTKYESDWKSDTSYNEKFTDNAGRAVSSRGVFQMSFESSKNYKCGLTDPAELFDATKNIRCAVRAFAVLVPDRIASLWPDSPAKISRPASYIAGLVGSTYQGAAAYWHPFRDARKAAMQLKTREACK
jgi:hypothetical protein